MGTCMCHTNDMWSVPHHPVLQCLFLFPVLYIPSVSFPCSLSQFWIAACLTSPWAVYVWDWEPVRKKERWNGADQLLQWTKRLVHYSSYSPAALGPPPPCPVKSNPHSTCTVSERGWEHVSVPWWELGSRSSDTIESVLLQWKRHGLDEPRSEITSGWETFLSFALFLLAASAFSWVLILCLVHCGIAPSSSFTHFWCEWCARTRCLTDKQTQLPLILTGFPQGSFAFERRDQKTGEMWQPLEEGSGGRLPFLKARDISLDLCSVGEKSELQGTKFFPLGLAGSKCV